MWSVEPIAEFCPKQPCHPENTCFDVRFEVFTAVTMENADFWDIKTQFVPHRKHITFSLKGSTG
jgi:hypothetical protein